MLEVHREYSIIDELEPLAKKDKTKYVFSYWDDVVFWRDDCSMYDDLEKYYNTKNENKFIKTYNSYLEQYDYFEFTICEVDFDNIGRVNCKFISEPMTIEHFIDDCYFYNLDGILDYITIEKIID